MAQKSKRGQAYRHTPAFILLLLAREKLYGAAILSRLEAELPGSNPDSAAIYRALQDLEDEACVSAEWETDIAGPARKWYSITEAGIKRLAELKADIEMRRRIFDWFLAGYASLPEAAKKVDRPEAGKTEGGAK
ncbi:MAG TPA: PadR family transcriptional regulator [Rectinemataceae bacterium]|nr:PadR family transcriptional regulator [Rectinemataceae bacterium]